MYKEDSYRRDDIVGLINSIISGASSKVTSLTLYICDVYQFRLTDDMVKQLSCDDILRCNTSQSFTILPFISVQVWEPGIITEVTTSIIPCTTKCLTLKNALLYIPDYLRRFFLPKLQSLSLTLNTAENVTELFTILQSNTTLKGLRVEITKDKIFSDLDMCTSLKGMLAYNQTLRYLEVHNQSLWDWFYVIPSWYLSFLTNGLIHNKSLQELSVSIPLGYSSIKKIKMFSYFISQKSHLTQLHMHFTLDESYIKFDEKDKEQNMAMQFYEYVLPEIDNILLSQPKVTFLKIQCLTRYIQHNLFLPDWLAPVQHFHETIFNHPSLEYVRVNVHYSFMRDTFKAQQTEWIERHKQEQPVKTLPVVEY